MGSSLLVSCHIYCLIQPTKKIFEVGKIQLWLIWIIRAWKHGNYRQVLSDESGIRVRHSIRSEGVREIFLKVLSE